MKIKTTVMLTLIAFTLSCGAVQKLTTGVREKFGKKEEPVNEDLAKPEVAKEEPISTPAYQKVQPAPQPVVLPPQMVSVAAPVVNIRSGPGMKNNVITTVKEGDELELLGKKDNWFNVRLSSGVEGWIYKKLIR